MNIRKKWAMPAVLFIAFAGVAWGQTVEEKSRNLVRIGLELAERTHYLEALDHLNEARDFMENEGRNQTREYSDLLFLLAQTKIKGRIHQGFPAAYVKSSLKDIQTANRLREKLPNMIPQHLAEGYYLEGYIHKNFFKRRDKAIWCLDRAVNLNPGHAAAKRELSELVASDSVR
jgi:tetratricopeptide (TPR) repeat protein